MTSVKDKIMDRIDFHEISIGSDLFEEFFNGCLTMRGSKFFLGRRRGQQEDNVCQWRWGGGGRGFISYNLDYNVI